MGRFSFCLPPFAPDYSECAGALFSLGGRLIVIHDAWLAVPKLYQL
ncbi:MAG: hypothetical protein ACLTSZ_14540 [Lachnospiraceae bacterium]